VRIVLQTESFDNSSGLGRIASALAAGFLRAGEEVHTVGQRNQSITPGITHHHVPGVRFSPAINKLTMRYFGSSITRSLGSDITHSFGVARGANVVSAQSCHRAGVDLARNMRSEFLPERNWGLFDRFVLGDELALMQARSTKRIIAVSNLVKQQLLTYYDMESEKIVVLPNGIHPEEFARDSRDDIRSDIRKRLKIKEDTRVLLFVGNEFGRKGLRCTIEALARLRARNICLLIAGRGDHAPYSRLARTLAIEDRVKFLGPVTPPEHIYAAADVFVFPTLYEPFGMVVIEAMAAGLPVVTSKSCGSVEGMRDGEDGIFLNHPESVEELHGALVKILDDEGLAKSLASKGIETARKFSWEAIIPQVLQVYRDVLNG